LDSSAVGVVYTLDTLLLVSGTGRSAARTVGVIETLHTSLFAEGACTGTRRGTVVIRVADSVSCSMRGSTDVTHLGITESVDLGLSVSPLGNWAVGRIQAFYTTSTLKLTVRQASVWAISILSTEVDTDAGKSIAVLIGCSGGWRTINT